MPLAQTLLAIAAELIGTALDFGLAEGTVVADRVGETDCVFLAAAPTGRAAKRMTEATGIKVRTLQRLLEADPVKGDCVSAWKKVSPQFLVQPR